MRNLIFVFMALAMTLVSCAKTSPPVVPTEKNIEVVQFFVDVETEKQSIDSFEWTYFRGEGLAYYFESYFEIVGAAKSPSANQWAMIKISGDNGQADLYLDSMVVSGENVTISPGDGYQIEEIDSDDPVTYDRNGNILLHQKQTAIRSISVIRKSPS